MRAIAAVLLLLAACGGGRQNIALPAPPDWRMIATVNDKERLRDWRTAFVEALADARRNGQQAALAREGRLLEPDTALTGGEPPPPGTYRCRTIKIGAKSPGMLSFIAYPAFSCRIEREGDVLSFTKSTGSQRPVGLIFPGEGPRHIFLGTLVLGDETRALAYGDDPLRDMAGAVERIEDDRWRLILPYPNYESIMDIIELVPASAGPGRGASAGRA